MITIERIAAKDFLSLEETVLDVRPGFHLIVGKNLMSDGESSNGSGKSSMMEVMPWVFYKYSNRQEVCKGGNGQVDASVTGIFKGERYSIHRYRNHKKMGNAVTIQKDGYEVSTPNIRVANKEIEDLIGIPQHIFLSSIIIPQGTPFNFTQLDPTPRKQLLEEITGFMWWDQIRPKFTASIETSRTEQKSISDKIDGINTSIQNTLDAIDKLQKDTTINVDNDRINELTDQIIQSNQQVLLIEKELDTILGGAAIQQLTDKERTLDRLRSSTQQQISDRNRLITEKMCPTCKQSYPEKMLQEAATMVEQLQNDLNTLSNKIKLVQDVISRHNSKKSELQAANETRNRLRISLNEEKRSVNKVESNQEAMIISLQESIKESQDRIDQLKPEVGKLENRLRVLNEINADLLPSSEFRTTSLNKFIDVLNTEIREICLSVDNNFVVTLVPEGKGIGFKVENNGKEEPYGNLSGGEKRRIDVIVLLSIQKFFLDLSGNDCNMIVFDEIFDNIDSIGIKIIVETIKNMFDETKCVFIITHNEMVKSSFDSIISVIKGHDGISRYDYSSYI